MEKIQRDDIFNVLSEENKKDQELMSRCKKYGITEQEILLITCLIGHAVHLYNVKGDDVKLMRLLDSAIKKCPKFDSLFDENNEREYKKGQFDGFLYRQDTYDLKTFSEGEVYVHPVSLTASIENLDNKIRIFKIRPLLVDKTKAHKLYIINNNIDRCSHPKLMESEWQVNFEKGTSFRVIKVETINDKTIITMEEI
ncbi:MAG: hypothetical protein KH100_15795 [Dysgonomonas mossii]|uniref:hypothetical protein n=1 Tax=Dysgonomonas mossii TaxID=163665 RepID=UPI001DB7B720|nr:hypothetical protein [Dysgonomonas mossii]MBS5798109.1 hypothetical protein [Dysgonomonas mossii]MBS7112646.1 hypothetical protein [Dysgonomonas mossii]